MINAFVVGDQQVGKTTIWESLQKDEFTPSVDTTVISKPITIIYNYQEITFWDTSSQPRFRNLWLDQLHHGHTFVIVYTPNQQNRRASINYWLNQILAIKTPELIFWLCNNTESHMYLKENDPEIQEFLTNSWIKVIVFNNIEKNANEMKKSFRNFKENIVYYIKPRISRCASEDNEEAQEEFDYLYYFKLGLFLGGLGFCLYLVKRSVKV